MASTSCCCFFLLVKFYLCLLCPFFLSHSIFLFSLPCFTLCGGVCVFSLSLSSSPGNVPAIQQKGAHRERLGKHNVMIRISNILLIKHLKSTVAGLICQYCEKCQFQLKVPPVSKMALFMMWELVAVRTKPYLQRPTTPKLQAAPLKVPQRAPIASASPTPPLLSRNKWMCKSTEMCLQEINYLSEIYCCEVSVILKSADIFYALIGRFKQGHLDSFLPSSCKY